MGTNFFQMADYLKDPGSGIRMPSDCGALSGAAAIASLE